MSNLVLVLVVFLIGMGWGAAAMVIPMRRVIIKNTQNMIEVLECLTNIAERQDAEVRALGRISKNCGEGIGGTKGVIESVDKLIEEIGNEV